MHRENQQSLISVDRPNAPVVGGGAAVRAQRHQAREGAGDDLAQLRVGFSPDPAHQRLDDRVQLVRYMARLATQELPLPRSIAQAATLIVMFKHLLNYAAAVLFASPAQLPQPGRLKRSW